MSEPPPDKYVGWLNAVKGLTLSNVVVIGLLLMLAIPAYTVWKALNDVALLDRLLSTYEEISNQQTGCTVRHVQERGGPDLWSISTGFAFAGSDRWAVNVILTHDPSENPDEIESYCDSLGLIADRMLERGTGNSSDGEILRRPVPGSAADGSGHDGSVPAAEEAEEAE